MKTSQLAELHNLETKEIKRAESSKRRKNYTEQIIQMLTRETSSDKRMNIFGADPFK